MCALLTYFISNLAKVFNKIRDGGVNIILNKKCKGKNRWRRGLVKICQIYLVLVPLEKF